MNHSTPWQTYDSIAKDYAPVRRTEPSIAERIHAALGELDSVVNVGAGTGSYEPTDSRIVAVEPSIEMIRRRPPGAAAAVQATAESIPLATGAVDAAMAVLTMQHWRDVAAALHELRRVARRRLLLVTMEVDILETMWFLADYVPEAIPDHRAAFPTIAFLEAELPVSRVETLPVPKDCLDGFVAAFWARPEAYLNPRITSASFLALPKFAAITPRATAALRRDLASGDWLARHGHLLKLQQHDVGLRLIVVDLD